jgi:RNA polymerase sigma-70 factor (ECF subfamily)
VLEGELLERARTGDSQAFGRLVGAYEDLIYGLVFRMVRDPSLAEELTQDTFVRAHRSLESFRGEARFTTWLYRIAVNLCHDQRGSLAARNRSRETSLEASEASRADPPATGALPDEALEAREIEVLFQAGLDALPAKYREAFLLRHQENLSYGEIAAILEISEGNAKVRVHRAREMVLEALRTHGFDV